MQRILNLQNEAEDSRRSFFGNRFRARFRDIHENDWFAGSIVIGILRNWIRGFFDDTVRPADPVTFAQLLQITFKAFEIEFEERDDENWQKPLIATAEKIPEMIFHPPNKILTRAEALEIIYLIERKFLRENREN